MRLGVFGGTFDPPHLGHFLTAVDALEALALDQVIIIPNFIQPLKGAGDATAEQRLKMIELMVQGDSRFSIDPIEVDRKGLSFTVDTLEALTVKHPGDTFHFLIGSDTAAAFSKFKDHVRIQELATLAVFPREGQGVGAGATEGVGGAISHEGSVPEGAVKLPSRRIDISSTEVRERVASGKSVRGFVHEQVEAFIVQQQLYVRDK